MSQVIVDSPLRQVESTPTNLSTALPTEIEEPVCKKRSSSSSISINLTDSLESAPLSSALTAALSRSKCESIHTESPNAADGLGHGYSPSSAHKRVKVLDELYEEGSPGKVFPTTTTAVIRTATLGDKENHANQQQQQQQQLRSCLSSHQTGGFIASAVPRKGGHHSPQKDHKEADENELIHHNIHHLHHHHHLHHEHDGEHNHHQNHQHHQHHSHSPSHQHTRPQENEHSDDHHNLSHEDHQIDEEQHSDSITQQESDELEMPTDSAANDGNQRLASTNSRVDPTSNKLTSLMQTSPKSLESYADAHNQENGEEEEEEEKEEEEEAESEFDPYEFMRNLPPIPDEYAGRASFIPPVETVKDLKCRATLVLDLDETLVHCSTDPLDVYDLTFKVDFSGVDYTVYARIRPYCVYFLQQVSKHFEVVVFTASQKAYADKILDILDPQRKYIQHRVFREGCVYVNGNYVKDLSILGRDLSKTMLVDNSPHAFGYQIDNGIPIESWYEDYEDEELLGLLTFLVPLATAKDVRPHIHEKYGTYNKVFSGIDPPEHMKPQFDIGSYFQKEDASESTQ